MTSKIVTFFLACSSFAAAHSDMTQRRWSVPEMTPIIEPRFDGEPDPFHPGPLITFQIFEKEDVKLWLQTQGVYFPPGGSARYVLEKNGERSLSVKARPLDHSLVEGILQATYPVHTSLQLLKRFLSETEGKKTAELPAIIHKYPARSLGPLRHITEELAKLDRQLEVKLNEKLKKTVTKRRDRIIKMLPESIKATRIYFETMTKIMAEES